MGLSKSICQLPLLVLPHLRPLGTSVGGKLLGTGASCTVTAVLKPCGGCICATTSLRVCDLAQVYPRILATSASEIAAMWVPAQWAGMVCWSLAAAEQWHHQHHQCIIIIIIIIISNIIIIITIITIMCQTSWAYKRKQ